MITQERLWALPVIVHKHNKKLGNKLLACVKTIGHLFIVSTYDTKIREPMMARLAIHTQARVYFNRLSSLVHLLEKNGDKWLMSSIRVEIDELFVISKLCHDIHPMSGDQIGNSPKIDSGGD